MFRPVASSVAVLSDFVANGHQTMHPVSSSLPKIPYVGFSPVRLQTGHPPPPSRPATHAPLIAGCSSRGTATPCTPLCGCRCRPPRTLRSRGPWLAVGLCCPIGSSLTTASSATLGLSRRFQFMHLYAESLPSGQGPELPQFALRVLPAVPPSIPRRAERTQRLGYVRSC